MRAKNTKSDSHPNLGHQLGAMLLVAGTCIGGGMLGLPVSTSAMGFVPSISMMALSWAMMTATALLYMEVSLGVEEGAHVMSMSSRLLGSWAKVVSLAVFIFVSYASIIAYTTAGGDQITEGLAKVFGERFSPHVGYLIFVLAFGAVIFFKTWFVEKVNALLFIGMLAAYFLLIGIGGDDVVAENLTHRSWGKAISGVPILLTSFSFQAFLVPTIVSDLKRDAIALRRVLIGGSLLTLLFYLVWQWLVLGTVSLEGPAGLAVALQRGDPSTTYFSRAVSSPLVALVAEFFAFFAVVTSFLGIGLGLSDFLSDSLKVEKTPVGAILIGILILVPVYFFANYFERVFTNALELTGGIGDTLINGMLPVMLVWVLRYRTGRQGGYRFFGGKAMLVFIFVFYFSVFLFEGCRRIF